MTRRPAPRVIETGHGDLESSLVLVFPLLLAYEIGVLFAGHVNGADVVTRALYQLLGSRTLYLVVHALIAVAFLVWIRHGNRRSALRLDVVAPVALEAAIYALTLGATITLLLHHVLGLGLDGRSMVSALGAGVHEELVFRLGLCSACVALFRGLGRPALAIAFIVSSFAFAGAHHLGRYGEPFTAHAFAFRALAGLAFAAIFWFRSLAHAVYAHVLYDLVVAATT